MAVRTRDIDRVSSLSKASAPTIGRGEPINSRGVEGDIAFRRTSSGLKLYIKASGKWHGVKVGESFNSLEKSVEKIKSTLRTMNKFKLPSVYDVVGNFALDSSGDIELNADGGQVTIKDNTANHFLFDCDNTAFTIYDDQDEGDLFKIQVAQHGATTISTIDDDADAANFTLDIDGDIELNAETGIINIKDNLTKNSFFRAASLNLLEQSGAHSDSANYGQIWIKNSTPNELSFTDDGGTDIVGIGKYHYETKVTNFYATATANFLPLAGYVFERTSLVGSNEFVAIVAPYDGTLERAVFRSEIAQDGDLIFALHESADGTEVPALGAVGSKTTAIDIADDTSVIVDFDSMTSGSNAITKGRIYAIKLTTPSGPQDTNVSLVFKWDTTS
tara:strand:+ start:1920 stop:3086 length:1167 start_codon:yes stop_codon:yes gene_type:complete